MSDPATRQNYVKQNRQHSGVPGKRSMNRIGSMMDNISVENMRSEITQNGIKLIGYGNPWKQQFELDITDVNTITIIPNGGLTRGRWFGGVKKTVTAGAGFTYDSDNELFDSDAISTDVFVYTECDIETAAYTLVMTETLPDGDEDTQIHPLYYIPWDSGSSIIDVENIEDDRLSKHIDQID